MRDLTLFSLSCRLWSPCRTGTWAGHLLYKEQPYHIQIWDQILLPAALLQDVPQYHRWALHAKPAPSHLTSSGPQLAGHSLGGIGRKKPLETCLASPRLRPAPQELGRMPTLYPHIHTHSLPQRRNPQGEGKADQFCLCHRLALRKFSQFLKTSKSSFQKENSNIAHRATVTLRWDGRHECGSLKSLLSGEGREGHVYHRALCEPRPAWLTMKCLPGAGQGLEGMEQPPDKLGRSQVAQSLAHHAEVCGVCFGGCLFLGVMGILSRRRTWSEPPFRKNLQVAERTLSEGMALERHYGRLAMIHNRGIRNTDPFFMCFKSTISPFTSIFLYSPRYIYLFCPRSLDKWSTWEKPAHLPARYLTLKLSASRSPIQGLWASGALAVSVVGE